MKALRMVIALTAINALLLIAVLVQARTSTAQGASPVVRARVLELVDDRGRIRSRLNVEPDGEVVLSLLDRNGTIRVKLGAGDTGSGLLLADEETEPAIHLVARRTATSQRPTTTSLTLRSPNGQRVISASGAAAPRQ